MTRGTEPEWGFRAQPLELEHGRCLHGTTQAQSDLRSAMTALVMATKAEAATAGCSSIQLKIFGL